MTPRHCICLFSTLYPPSVGGVETYVSNLARALAALGHRVIVATCSPEGAGEPVDEGGIEVLRIPAAPLLAGRYPVPRRTAAVRRGWEWLDRQPITHIEVHTRFYPLCPQALAFARCKGVVPVVLEHGSAHLTLGSPLADAAVHAVEHFMTRRCLKHPARFYAVSRKASAWLSHFGLPSCGELPNSIDADAYAQGASQRDFRRELGIGRDTLLVAFVGRLVPEKGVAALAQAARSLVGDDVAIALAGNGPLAHDLGEPEAPTLRLLGGLAPADVAALLLQADALCLPSRSEGFATALLEAAACSTCAIVTDVGGTDELIPDADHGILLPDASPRAIADALRAAARDRGRLHEIGANAAKLVRAEYSWRGTALKTLRACTEANGA